MQDPFYPYQMVVRAQTTRVNAPQTFHPQQMPPQAMQQTQPHVYVVPQYVPQVIYQAPQRAVPPSASQPIYTVPSSLMPVATFPPPPVEIPRKGSRAIKILDPDTMQEVSVQKNAATSSNDQTETEPQPQASVAPKQEAIPNEPCTSAQADARDKAAADASDNRKLRADSEPIVPKSESCRQSDKPEKDDEFSEATGTNDKVKHAPVLKEQKKLEKQAEVPVVSKSVDTETVQKQQKPNNAWRRDNQQNYNKSTIHQPRPQFSNQGSSQQQQSSQQKVDKQISTHNNQPPLPFQSKPEMKIIRSSMPSTVPPFPQHKRVVKEAPKEVKKDHRYTCEQFKEHKHSELVEKETMSSGDRDEFNTSGSRHNSSFGKNRSMQRQNSGELRRVGSQQDFNRSDHKSNSPNDGRQPMEGSLLSNEEVKLNKAENAYVPSFMQKKNEVKDDELSALERLERLFRSVLNRLTPQNFENMLKEITKMSIDSSEKLLKIVDLLFEKTIAEPEYAKLYAQLCRYLSTVSIKDEGSNDSKSKTKSTLKVHLITRCQLELENVQKNNAECDALASKIIDLDEIKRSISAIHFPPDRGNWEERLNASVELKVIRKDLIKKYGMEVPVIETELDDDDHNSRKDLHKKNLKYRARLLIIFCDKKSEELGELRKEMRRRADGTIKYIGELFKTELLTIKIMRSCIKILMESPDPKKVNEDSLERLCKLLTTIGKVIEEKYPAHASILDQTLAKLQWIFENKNIKMQSRIRFELQNVCELRQRKWISRKDQRISEINAKKLAELEREEKRKEEAKARKQQYNEMMERSQNAGHHGSRHGKQNRGRKSRNKVGLGGAPPSSQNFIKPQQQPQAHSNPFSLLAEDSDGSDIYADRGNHNNRGRGRDGNNNFNRNQQEPATSGVKMTILTRQQTAPAIQQKANLPPRREFLSIDKEEFEENIKMVLYDKSMSIEELFEKLDGYKIENNKVLADLLYDSLEKSDNHRELLAEIIIAICKSGKEIISQKDFDAALSTILMLGYDLSVDFGPIVYSHIDKYFAKFVAANLIAPVQVSDMADRQGFIEHLTKEILSGSRDAVHFESLKSFVSGSGLAQLKVILSCQAFVYSSKDVCPDSLCNFFKFFNDHEIICSDVYKKWFKALSTASKHEPFIKRTRKFIRNIQKK